MRAEFKRTGRWLASIRESRNMTQAELGRRLNMHSQYLSNFERGLCMPPKAKLKRLTRILNISRVERDQITQALEFDTLDMIRREYQDLMSV